MDALSSFTFSYSQTTTTSISLLGPERPKEDKSRWMEHAQDHGRGHHGDKQGDEGSSWSQPVNPMERAINKIIEIIMRMQEGDGQQAEQPAVDETGGNILSAEGTDSADTMTFSAIAMFSLTAKSGNDTITIKAASATQISLDAGDDNLNLSARFLSEISGGDGNDQMTMAGDLATGIDGGAGDDVMKIAALTILGAYGGDGNDTMSLQGSRIFAAGGAGDDAISIDNQGDQPAELSFGRGDGHDTIQSNGAISIRFTMTQFQFASSGGGSYGPDDLSVSAASLSIVIKSNDGRDSLTINFAAGSLKASTPQWDFTQDKGDWLMKIS